MTTNLSSRFGRNLPTFSLRFSCWLFVALLLTAGRAAMASSVPVSVYGYDPQAVAPNETAHVFLSASIDDEPDGNQECTLTDENWSWSVTALKHSTNGGQSWTSIQPPYTMATFDPTNQSYTDLSVTLGSPGLWKFTVAASVSYKSNCGDGSGSGNTDVTVKVGAGPKN